MWISNNLDTGFLELRSFDKPRVSVYRSCISFTVNPATTVKNVLSRNFVALTYDFIPRIFSVDKTIQRIVDFDMGRATPVVYTRYPSFIYGLDEYNYEEFDRNLEEWLRALWGDKLVFNTWRKEQESKTVPVGDFLSSQDIDLATILDD